MDGKKILLIFLLLVTAVVVLMEQRQDKGVDFVSSLEQQFGGGEILVQGQPQSQGLSQSPQGSSVAPDLSSGGFRSYTCGEIGMPLESRGVVASCFNVMKNWNDRPDMSTGACIQTNDCDCCFLQGIPPQASEAVIIQMLQQPQSLQVPSTLSQSEVPIVSEAETSVVVQPPRERKPLIGTIILPERKAFMYTVSAFVALVLVVGVFESTNLISFSWLPLVALGYTLLLGVSVWHVWGFLLPFQIPYPTGDMEYVAWVLLLIGLVGGYYLARTKTVDKVWLDLLGYLMILLTGIGASWLFNLSRFLPTIQIY